MTPQERAQEGAQRLDAVYPGWEAWIDLDALDLLSCADCICGQIYKAQHPESKVVSIVAYADVLNTVGGASEEFDLGFITRGDEDEPTELQQLEDAWGTEVQRRLDASEDRNSPAAA